ncbi:hypothetical protein B488_12390 [Liberibacter crescens BT-1]|uniref:Uncharacterized protein n=1 Tax=Liberibacter crescens (strain BT-1) TaxID=1215343 RepID=L0EXX4_LIBCB|nr:hypothetical protein B488_12390 [Liberibacter crescens BT-1]
MFLVKDLLLIVKIHEIEKLFIFFDNKSLIFKNDDDISLTEDTLDTLFKVFF